MSIIDSYCLDCFPELTKKFSTEELEEASDTGTYIFHEDYFAEWVLTCVKSHSDLKRVGEYIEYLSSSENDHMKDLARIGLIENFINRDFTEIASYFGKNSLKLLEEAKKTTKFDYDKWFVSNL